MNVTIIDDVWGETKLSVLNLIVESYDCMFSCVICFEDDAPAFITSSLLFSIFFFVFSNELILTMVSLF